MKISVVMATYNGEKYVLEQLESILSQTRLPDEIVISDDNSSDATFKIISEFAAQKGISYSISFSLKRNNKNLGFAKNFRNAIDSANGDLIILCDQDDIFEKNKIKTIEDFFLANKRAKIFISAFRMIDSIGRFISGIQPFKKNKIITIDELLKGNSYPGCTIAFRSELKKYYDYFNDLIFAHDWFLLLLASFLDKDSIYYSSIPLVHYRMHRENTLGLNYNYKIRYTLSKRLEGIRKINALFHELINILRTESSLDRSIELILNQIKFNEMRIAFLENKMSLIRILPKIFMYQNVKMFLGDLAYK